MVFAPSGIDWKAPAGRLLTLLSRKLRGVPAQHIVVFGSAPLQLFIEPHFLSQDVDIIPTDDIEDLTRPLSMRTGNIHLRFQVCNATAFRTAAGWEQRAVRVRRHGHTFVFPHPWDILVSKVERLEEKELEAFRLVIRKTGHPTAAEFRRRLQLAVDLYRPHFEEEPGDDMAANTQRLWREIFRADIDVLREIVRPALQRRRKDYDTGDPKLKERLRHLKPGKTKHGKLRKRYSASVKTQSRKARRSRPR